MTNLNFPDWTIRALLGIVFLGWAFFWLPSGNTAQFIAYAVGVILLAVAEIKFCTNYRLLESQHNGCWLTLRHIPDSYYMTYNHDSK